MEEGSLSAPEPRTENEVLHNSEDQADVLLHIVGHVTPVENNQLKKVGQEKDSPGWSLWCISRWIRSENPSPSSSLSTGDSRPMSQSLSPASLSPRPLSFRLNLSMSCNAYLSGGSSQLNSVTGSNGGLDNSEGINAFYKTGNCFWDLSDL